MTAKTQETYEAVEAALADGAATKKEAMRQVAESMGDTPATISARYYRYANSIGAELAPQAPWKEPLPDTSSNNDDLPPRLSAAIDEAAAATGKLIASVDRLIAEARAEQQRQAKVIQAIRVGLESAAAVSRGVYQGFEEEGR